MLNENNSLYNREFEHDACGVGFTVNINGKPSHQIVKDGITILKNLIHRGAVGGDMKTGDGAGILIQIPHDFFEEELYPENIKLGDPGTYGVGFFFFEKDKKNQVDEMISDVIKTEGGTVLGFRDVPVNPDCLGEMALESMPFMQQVFVNFEDLKADALERKLYVARRCIENKAVEMRLSQDQFYIPSFSSQTIIYKGLFVAPQLEAFFPDLTDSRVQSSLALVHQRYSTNTFPSWPLAQPFRYLAHNGEINTLKGNVNRMKARESTLSSGLFGDDIKKLLPVIQKDGSDSAMFDNTFELLTSAGRSIEHTMMMMIPETFGQQYHISTDKRAFYEYHAAFMEPWDGPAAIAFTDGKKIGAILDRNGLRPARYVITKSGRVVLASEMGVLDIPPEDILEKGRLAPGKMILVDTTIGRVKKDNEIKASVSRQKLYRRWLEENRIELKGLLQHPSAVSVSRAPLIKKQIAFGYTLEDINMILAPMVENCQEPVGSMGDDEPVSVLSDKPQMFFRYFKQLFAQVTNPPIDPYRENLVMSLMDFVGREQNLLEESPMHCNQLKLSHPILTNDDTVNLLKSTVPGLSTCLLSIHYEVDKREKGMEEALDNICRQVESSIDSGCSIIILSDRGIDEKYAPIPSLLAVACVNNYLVKLSKRHLSGIIIQTGEAREVMDFAALIGFGASAINPYLAFETIAELKEKEGAFNGMKLEIAFDNYITAIKKGLLKIMSKMGVSTIRSYKGAQIFEAVGLSSGFINKYFPGLHSRIEGVGLDVIAQEIALRHSRAFNSESENKILDSGGHYHYRKNSEKHRLSPEVIVTIQKATRENDYALYRKYANLINDQSREFYTLRGLFEFDYKNKPVPLEEVESEQSIIKRFVNSAMSFGSISKEAHETIAIAMNRLGAQSNSGEGGEDEARYAPLPNGDSLKSKIKQVASGRFGVNSNYLANAEELQIKMAQGAKPGEGGQLPGHKVNDIIASVRYSTPGVMLISPPPHHDIYSIEDLAQLIYDLKNANPTARVSVKLVSEIGVGTVAAGVAKGRADMVLISGGDGGTGASPLSSIKHAGIPWELGLSETQQTLVRNKLRDKIRVQVDGQLRTGRDIIIAALLGAEEFGFATISLVTLGCVMMRKCHMNTCPVGVATQDETLRKRFSGKPEYLMNFMKFLAKDVREHMAELGFRTVDEMVGQVSILKVKKAVDHWKAKGLDFSRILSAPVDEEGSALRCIRNEKLDLTDTLDEQLIQNSTKALENSKRVSLFTQIQNHHRSVGARLSWEVSRRYGAKGLPDNTIECKFTGVAGQSFGAFLANGITFELEGDANDYMGKGLSGGRIILYPQKGSTYRSQNNIITGNVNLFGATKGEVFIHGMAGERFAVRNSGAIAVVEGVGDHGCEYMTGGVVVVLGRTGVNFGAGMSGGLAYVLDENQLFDTMCNLEMVDLEPVVSEEDKKLLHGLIKRHIFYTNSKYASQILHDWEEMLPKFVKVFPIDYKKAMERITRKYTKSAEVLTITEEVY
ncbi:MAG: glutamate synthase large subunit [Spirochaetales bacterium]|nr:glutamate synthase large subunit [Spirochaetales bacterium]